MGKTDESQISSEIYILSQKVTNAMEKNKVECWEGKNGCNDLKEGGRRDRHTDRY